MCHSSHESVIRIYGQHSEVGAVSNAERNIHRVLIEGVHHINARYQ